MRRDYVSLRDSIRAPRSAPPYMPQEERLVKLTIVLLVGTATISIALSSSASMSDVGMLVASVTSGELVESLAGFARHLADRFFAEIKYSF